MANKQLDIPPSVISMLVADDNHTSFIHPERHVRPASPDIREPYPRYSLRWLGMWAPKSRVKQR